MKLEKFYDKKLSSGSLTEKHAVELLKLFKSSLSKLSEKNKSADDFFEDYYVKFKFTKKTLEKQTVASKKTSMSNAKKLYKSKIKKLVKALIILLKDVEASYNLYSSTLLYSTILEFAKKGFKHLNKFSKLIGKATGNKNYISFDAKIINKQTTKSLFNYLNTVQKSVGWPKKKRLILWKNTPRLNLIYKHRTEDKPVQTIFKAPNEIRQANQVVNQNIVAAAPKIATLAAPKKEMVTMETQTSKPFKNINNSGPTNLYIERVNPPKKKSISNILKLHELD